MDGEPRWRENVMRTLEKADRPMLSSMQIYQVQPHQAAKDKTPTEVARATLVAKISGQE